MKPRRQLGVYYVGPPPDHLSCFTHDFELYPAASPPSLQKLVASQVLHGIMLHYAVLSREHISALAELKACSAWLPLIVVADAWDSEAVKHCGEIGIDAFLPCAEKPETKLARIASVLRTGGFRRLLTEMRKPPMAWPLRMKQAFELLLAKFPQTPSLDEISASLGIHRRTFEKEFHQTFGLSYVPFLRALFMYEAWHLKHYTQQSSSEVAAFLGYRAESHLARDCQKLLQLTPKQLRELSEKEFRALMKRAFDSKRSVGLSHCGGTSENSAAI